MVSNETKLICEKVTSAVEELIRMSAKEFSDASDRLLAAEKILSYAQNMTVTLQSAYDTLCDIPKRINAMVTAQLVRFIEPSGIQLNKMLEKKDMEVEEAWYIVEHLKSLVEKAKILTYTKEKHGFNAKCYEPMQNVVSKFSEAVFNHPAVQRVFKQEQLEKNQKDLAQEKKTLEENKHAAKKCKDEILKIFNRYNNYVSKVLAKAQLTYKTILKNIETKQQELVEKSKTKSETFDLLARASIFNKRKRKFEYIRAEDDYKKIYDQLKQEKEKLRSFASSSFALKYDTIDKQVDDLSLKIKKINNDIKANETAIESYENAIKRLKGELNE